MKSIITKIKELAAAVLRMLDTPRIVSSVSWNF